MQPGELGLNLRKTQERYFSAERILPIRNVTFPV